VHLGVHLAVRPEGGGMYQYCLAVARGLDPRRSGWKLTAFIEDPAWRSILPREFQLETIRSPWLNRAVCAAYRRVDRSLDAPRRSAFLFPHIPTLDRSGCDLVVFPGQDPASYRTRKPALVAIHDLMHRYEPNFEEYQGGMFELRERHYRSICAFAAAILVDSELGKRHVIESYGREPDTVFVLPFVAPDYLAEAPKVDVLAKYGLPSKYFFYPAQFWEHKNHLRLVEAIAIAKGRRVPVKLVLTGSPRDAHDRIVCRIAELGLSEDVRILGYVPSADMAALYRNAVATVFVSLIGPTNIPPLEAMAMGSPLVVSNIYAMPEQVGDAALLVDPRNADDIADKIERIWTDAALRALLAKRGLARTAAWTQEDFGLRLREIVQAVAGAS
jgi:glycosyltransferase involved in cell wall biosynthesis